MDHRNFQNTDIFDEKIKLKKKNRTVFFTVSYWFYNIMSYIFVEITCRPTIVICKFNKTLFFPPTIFYKSMRFLAETKYIFSVIYKFNKTIFLNYHIGFMKAYLICFEKLQAYFVVVYKLNKTIFLYPPYWYYKKKNKKNCCFL